MSAHQRLRISHGKLKIIVEGGVCTLFQWDMVVDALCYTVKIENKSLFM